MMGNPQQNSTERKGRVVALVIAGTMLLWLLAQWAGPKMGLPGRYALLIDFAAIAAFIWAFVVALQIWRARQDNNSNGQG